MSKIKFALAAALILSTSAAAAATKPEGQAQELDARAFPNLTLIYVASGVRDNGAGVNTGVATSIHCTNFTAATQQVRFLIRLGNGSVVANATFAISSLGTFTASTHPTAAYGDDGNLASGTSKIQGSLRIFATAAQVTCTAVVIDASAIAPIGTNLHLVRHNAWPGTQE